MKQPRFQKNLLGLAVKYIEASSYLLCFLSTTETISDKLVERVAAGHFSLQPVVIRGTMKPIATLLQGMDSVSLISGGFFVVF